MFFSETLISSRRHISELMTPGFGRLMQVLKSEVNRYRELAVYVRDSLSPYRQRSYEYGCCKIMVFRICSNRHNFYVFGVYRNSGLSENTFHCLFTAMTKIHYVEEKRLSCLLEM